MKLKLKTVLASLALAAGLFMMPQVNALADGPAYKEVEPNNFNFDGNKIVLYDCITGTLPQGDTDWYKIYLPVSESYNFWLKSTYSSSSFNVTVYDENRNVVFSGSPNATNIVSFDSNLKGLYYVKVKDEGNFGGNVLYNFEFASNDSHDSALYRFAGVNRYDTSYNIFKNNWNYCSYAVITTGESFPDALSAAPLAKKYNAPIILTDPKELSTNVENQLRNTGVKNVFIIGGTGAVSQSVEDKLGSMGITCRRIAGQSRYDTSLNIAKYLNPNGKAIVATGRNFPDALSIASIAACNETPILLVDNNDSNDNVLKYIKDNGIIKTVIVGGTGVVSGEIETSLNKITTTTRLAGSNRYGTNIEILKYYQAELRLNEMYFATGLNFPDALSGSVIAAAGANPVVLIDKEIDSNTRDYLVINSNRVFGRCIFGGEGIIPTTTVSQFFH